MVVRPGALQLDLFTYGLCSGGRSHLHVSAELLPANTDEGTSCHRLYSSSILQILCIPAFRTKDQKLVSWFVVAHVPLCSYLSLFCNHVDCSL